MEVIGHAEKIKQACPINIVRKDPMGKCLYQRISDIDNLTLDISESRIALDLPSNDKIDLEKINCHSGDSTDFDWLTSQHLQYESIFSLDQWDVGSQNGSSVHFQVRDQATICHQRATKINPKIKQQADDIISMLLSRKLIQISKSPWSSRVLFVQKAPEDASIKDEGVPGEKCLDKPRRLRIVVDFRFVNTRLLPLNTCFPSPTIMDILTSLHSASYVSITDVSQGFWHFKISTECRGLTAFTYGDVNYEFLRLPQGLSISSKIMQYKIKKFISKYNLQGCLAYIDNIIIFA